MPKTPKRISVAAFAREQALELRQFLRYWARHQRAAPTKFPETLPPGEWFEQYEAWRTSHPRLRKE